MVKKWPAVVTSRLAAFLLVMAVFIGSTYAGFYSEKFHFLSEKLYFLLWEFILLVAVPWIFFVRLRNYLLILAGIAVPLGLFEIGAESLNSIRASYYSPRFDGISDYPAKYFDASDLGSQPRPGIFRARKISSSGSVIFDIRYTIGDDRFRVTPQKSDKSGSRINFFGCSLMIGEGLEDTETLPYFFSRKIPGVGVKNFGSHGFGVHQALAVLESDRNTSGDLNFLLTAPWHAERMVCIARESASKNPVYLLTENGDVIRNGDCVEIENNYRAPPLFTRIADKSNLGRLIKGSFRDGALQDNQMNLYMGMIRKISAVSKTRKQGFIVGFVKADESYFTGNWSNERILKQLDAWGIDTIDMTLADRSENIPDIYYIHDEERHPSAVANERRATLLADHVRQARKISSGRIKPAVKVYGTAG